MRSSDSKKTRLLAVLLLPAVLLVSACGSTSATEDSSPALDEITLRLAHPYAPSALQAIELEKVAGRVEDRSDGRIRIEIFPSGELGAIPDSMEQVASGANMIAWFDAAIASTAGVPELGILGGPFLFDGTEQAREFLRGDLFAEWEQKLADEANIRVLGLNWFTGARHLHGNKSFESPDDLKGLKMRVVQAPTYIKIFEMLGAVPTAIDFVEVYSALDQGVVDAYDTLISAIKPMHFEEVAKDLTLTGHIVMPSGVSMSEEVYQSLTKDLQDILYEEFQAGGVNLGKEAAAAEGDMLAQLEADGVNIHRDVDFNAYREATKDYYTSFPEWPAGLYDAVLAELARLE